LCSPLRFLLTGLIDTVTDFSWEPKGERFAIVASNDPNLGNSGAGVTIKTDVSFYQLDRSKNDFKILRVYFEDFCGRDLNINLPVSLQTRWRAARQTRSDGRRGDATSCSRRSALRRNRSWSSGTWIPIRMTRRSGRTQPKRNGPPGFNNLG
jgi:hypothetical protein